MDITSVQNPRVKHIVKLRDDKRQRQKDGLTIVEGYDELRNVIETGFKPTALYTSPELVSRSLNLIEIETHTVSPHVFEKISYRDNPDGWLGVFAIPSRMLKDIRLPEVPLVIVIESIEKPGNLGAILRTADAAGVDLVLVCEPKADVWNPNVIRASRGAVFSIPVIELDNPNALAWLKSNRIQSLAATPSAAGSYTEVNLCAPLAIVLGTEDRGLSEFWMSHADLKVRIPMMGRINSLNVSISAALITYEALRQRKSW